MVKSICSIDGCDKPSKTRGWCNQHYLRWFHYGDPLKVKPRPYIMVLGPDECWPWTGAPSGGGYFQRWFDGRFQLVHRLAYMEQFGSIPDGVTVDHICRNRRCCNPQHLRLATSKQQAENRRLPSNNKSGYRGVRWESGKWRARVSHNRKQIHVGLFDTAEAAAEAARLVRLGLFTHNDEDRSA